MEINSNYLKTDISYLTSTKYVTQDILVKDEDKAYTSGTVIVSQNKLLIVKGLLTCL
jgi:hypothetical protein